MKLYFISGRNGWDTVCAGHYLANSPKEAIALMQADMRGNPYTESLASVTEWKAKISKSNPADYAMNLNRED